MPSYFSLHTQHVCYCLYLDRALTLASPEVNFSLDNETHDPISVKTKQLL